MGCPSGLTSTASGSYKGSSSPTLPELNRSTSAVAMSSGRVGGEKDADISVSRSCWLNCDTTIIPLDRVLLPGQDGTASCPQQLTSRHRAVLRSRGAAGNATCLGTPPAPGLISGL